MRPKKITSVIVLEVQEDNNSHDSIVHLLETRTKISNRLC